MGGQGWERGGGLAVRPFRNSDVLPTGGGGVVVAELVVAVVVRKRYGVGIAPGIGEYGHRRSTGVVGAGGV